MHRIGTKMVLKALERGELELFYQPQVNIRSNSIVGLEALLRWPHPRLGNITPHAFLSVIERTDSMIRIGNWTIESVCSQNKVWQGGGLTKIPVAINVSAYQLENGNILPFVTAALQSTGLAPEFLEIEITENIAIRNIREVAKTLEALKRTGVKIAIDDFGTQYASFGYIKDLPVDIVKIDKCFIDEIGCNPKAEAILLSMVSLMDKLQIQIIAEGVETKQQMSFLGDIGCNLIQGFYYYRPMPANAVAELLTKR